MKHARPIVLMLVALTSGCRCMRQYEHAGRYQLTKVAGDGLLLLDTESGKSWLAEGGTEYKTVSWHPNPLPPGGPK
jgi:hypothetical protein